MSHHDPHPPNCPRCNNPLLIEQSVASHSGPVHPECVRPEDAQLPVFREQPEIIAPERAAPKYGGPPIQRMMRSLVLLLPLIAAVVFFSKRCNG